MANDERRGDAPDEVRSTPSTTGDGSGMTRRRALGVIGGTTAVLLADSSMVGAQTQGAEPAATAPGGPMNRRQIFGGPGQAPAATVNNVTAAFSSPPVRTVRFTRAEDQLDVVVELFDVTLSGDQFSPSSATGAVRLTFGSQHTAETAFQAVGAITPPTTAVDHTAARTSQLVAPVTGTHTLSVAGVLALIEQALDVQAAAGTADTDATILEIPAGLALSPGAGTVVDAAAAPFTVGDTTELWLADLTAPGGSVDLLAVENLAVGDLTNAIPTSVDRDNLVVNTTAGPAITASKLTLSSSGAFADLEGEWPGQTLIGYRQHISTGRDVSVEIENTGYLAPFGIRAAITTTTERVFTTDTANELTSAMKLERFLTILEPTIDLGGRDHQADGGRRNLWTSISATTDESREVVLTPVADGSGDIPGVDDVTYLDDGTDLVIDYVAVDRNGDEVVFSLPATYITADEAHQTGANSATERLADEFNTAARNKFRDIVLNGQRVAFADAVASGQTSKSAQTMRFELDLPDAPPPGFFENTRVPAFNPAMKQATILDEVVGDGVPFRVEFHPRWIDFGISNGNSQNFDLAFLKLQTPKSGVIGGDLPTVSVAAIEVIGEIFNQVSGPAPDLPDIDTPWDPVEALGEGSKLLGSLLLSELMVLKPPRLAVPGIDIPNTEITVTTEGVTVIYSFKPELKSVPALGFVAKSNTQACVSITTEAPFEGDPTVVTETVVTDFDMVFPPGGAIEIITIDFESVKAIVASDGGLSVIPSIRGWTLGSDLNLLQPVLGLLDQLGDLSVNIGSVYLDLDASVNLPSLSFGIVTIQNFHLDFELGLPLQGDPVQIGVGVGSPSDQLEVSAGFLGGSFFTTVDLEYHESLVDWRVAAGISLFAQIGFDAVVVSASVKLRCSLTFVFNKSENGGTVKVTGAVSLEGEVSVLGLIEVSVKLVASITYNSGPETATVKGTIHWGVDTALGAIEGKHKIGKITYELGDNSAAGDLARSGLASDSEISAASRTSFGDLMSQANWSEYSNAFA